MTDSSVHWMRRDDHRDGERHWLELRLYELATVVRAAGKEAILYCTACQAVISYSQVVAGPIRRWPYCPHHPEKPLMFRSAPLTVCAPQWSAPPVISLTRRTDDLDVAEAH